MSEVGNFFSRDALPVNPAVDAGRLRYVGILTEQAFEIAPGRGDRIARCAGKEMKQRFFFDRIDMLGDHFPVNQAPELSIPVLADPAFSRLIRLDMAVLGAEKAVQPVFVQPPVQHSLFHYRPFDIE